MIDGGPFGWSFMILYDSPCDVMTELVILVALCCYDIPTGMVDGRLSEFGTN